jgi:hypothetical protein
LHYRVFMKVTIFGYLPKLYTFSKTIQVSQESMGL